MALVLAHLSHAAVAQEPPDILRSAATQEAIEYKFSAADERLLDAVQRGCFNYLWSEVHPKSGLVKDRREVNVCSTAGVGFQLSAIPIAIERGWITREQGEQRALRILKTLAARTDNRKFGVLLHFVDLETGGVLPGRRSDVASTVDHALFLAGAIAAAEYLGGEVRELVNKFIADTNWKAFDVSERGFITMGWRAADTRLDGPGDFSKFDWHVASDEELLVYFLAAGSPNPDFAGDPRDYYRLERTVKRHGDLDPYVVSWNGSLFTYFFAHCWIDYARFAADEPGRFDVDAPRVDWLENSRRATLTHRRRCIEAADRFKTLAENRWGFAPCTGLNAQGKPGYLVQGLRPNLMDKDEWDNGTVAPYAAGSSIMFTPAESMAALRAYRNLKTAGGQPLVWRDPAEGGYAFADSFNLDQPHVSDDNIAIDVGPMLVAIENVRTGLVWRLFMQHEVARRAVDALELQPQKGTKDAKG
ncbi:MAG TPA: glucoamylase family protein [Lacipirellula sp.]